MFYVFLLAIVTPVVVAQHTHDEDHENHPIDPTALTGVELYDWLGIDGYYTDHYSDKELQDLVASGLISDDPHVVSATIGSLAWYAVHSFTQVDESGNPRFDRGLNKVPDLKENLIEVWRANKTEESYPLTEENIDESVEVRNELLVLAHEFVWSYVPPILAVLFPADDEVHELLWDGYDSENPATILDWLNRGRFTTERATKLRLEVLNEIDGPAPVLAVIGLGFTQTAEALSALVDRLQTDPGNRVLCAYLIDSIAEHGTRALPHLNSLRTAAKEADLLPPEGSTLVRPEGYGIGTDIGIEYRTQQALRKLEVLEENSPGED